MILRMRPLAPPVRSTNQQLSALSGWKRSQRHASCNRIRRSRGLPALLMPCSRSEPPLLNGVPVRPTNPAIARRSANERQNPSRVSPPAGSPSRRRLQTRLEAGDPRQAQQVLDAVLQRDPLADQPFALPLRPPHVFLGLARDAHHRAYPRFTPPPRQQGAQQH